jgi:UDP-N-acetylglucosamine diphosphorylase/glucosamine-1-phosphate N-acetyltransferase
LPNGCTLRYIHDLKEGEKLVLNGDVLAAKMDGESASKMHQKNEFLDNGLKEIGMSESSHLEHLWDLIGMNISQIKQDVPLTGLKNITETGLGSEAITQYQDDIYISEDVMIEPGCIFSAKDGPIVIERGAIIEAGSILRGPVAVCEGATVKMAARIYDGTTIGPVCKVGGEVAGSLFHSYSNKAHDGFVGNSVFGQWVNLGANTVTSNLKNDYKHIKVIEWESKEPIDTGRQFFGTVMGDHSKTAINTMLNTGTICGVSSNVFIDELSPKVINSFTWLGPTGPKPYRFEKAIQVMEAMMKRRNITLSDGYRNMMHSIFENR